MHLIDLFEIENLSAKDAKDAKVYCYELPDWGQSTFSLRALPTGKACYGKSGLTPALTLSDYSGCDRKVVFTNELTNPELFSVLCVLCG